MKEATDSLLAEIRHWKKQTKFYRTWNCVLFGCFKLIIPFGSLTVATSTFSRLQGLEFFSEVSTVIIAGIVLVISGLDSFLNPGTKKKLAFRKYNALRALESQIAIRSETISANELEEFLLGANEELKGVLDNYAENGY